LAFGAGVVILRRAERRATSTSIQRTTLTGSTAFADLSGVKINRIDMTRSAGRTAQGRGRQGPCDVFITTDAGRIERARQMGLLQPVTSGGPDQVGAGASADPDSNWFGFSSARA
jgi:iron(III) transport system substrate-binding protein